MFGLARLEDPTVFWTPQEEIRSKEAFREEGPLKTPS